MRIISGNHRGRKIVAPKNLPVRPTTDFAKEGLFNIIANHFDLEETTILDLFSGTGSIAYEFASRDCKSITSVDINSNCTRFIYETAKKLDLDNLSVIRADVFIFLKRNRLKYDIIFADPPYDFKELDNIPSIVLENDLLNDGGWLILEHSRFSDFRKYDRFQEQRKYGNVNFSVFK